MCRRRSRKRPKQRHSRPGARPSSGATSQKAASSPAPAARKDRRGFRQARSGIAPEEFPQHPAHPRAAALRSLPPATRAPRRLVRSTRRSSRGALQSVCVPCRLLPRRRRRPAAVQRPCSSNGVQRRSSQSPQLVAEFACGAEQGILHGFLSGAQRVADRAQLQALIVLHFKHDALAR